MGSIPLPALHINPPAPQANPLEQYGQLLQLKNEMQNGPLRQQLLRQQVQNEQTQGQVQQAALQEHQQGLQDQAAFRTAMQAPEMQGRTIGEVADALAQKGAISQTAWTSAKKADTEQQKAVAELTKDKLSNSKEALAQIGQLYGNVMNLPDDQYAQNWPQIAQQYDSLIKGQTGFPPLDPNKPLPKEALAQFGPMISLHSTYLDQELARREKTAAVTEKENEAQFGGNQQMADSKYRFLQQKVAAGQTIAPDDQNFLKAYEKQKLLVPQATAQVRIDGLQQSREYPVFDNQTHTTLMLNAADINAANRAQPGRYAAPGYSPEALGQKGTTEYFTKGAGGKQLTAFNTAMTHLDLLDKLGTDLNNTDVQIANRAKQAWAEQTGNPAPANFAAAKNAMSGEVAAALKASGATDPEIAKVDSTFSRVQSPAQLKGAINTYRSLLQSKAGQLQEQYQQGMQGKPNFQGQSAGSVSVTAPNGKVYSFKDQASADAFKQKAGIQ